MSSPDNTKIQVNFRAGEDLINVYGTDQDDLEAGLAALAGAHSTIVQVGALLRGGAAAAPVVQPAAPQWASQPAPGGAVGAALAAPPTTPAPVQQAAPAAGNGHQCLHGARVFKSGNGAKGPWAAWFCSQPQNAADKCEPQWVSV